MFSFEGNLINRSHDSETCLNSTLNKLAYTYIFFKEFSLKSECWKSLLNSVQYNFNSAPAKFLLGPCMGDLTTSHY